METSYLLLLPLKELGLIIRPSFKWLVFRVDWCLDNDFLGVILEVDSELLVN